MSTSSVSDGGEMPGLPKSNQIIYLPELPSALYKMAHPSFTAKAGGGSMTPEGKVVMYIRRRISKAGGTVRKCSWEGRIAAPDLLVMVAGQHFWVEAKAPGQKPRPAQLREHEVMRRVGGCAVYVCDSGESVDRLLAELGVADGNL